MTFYATRKEIKAYTTASLDTEIRLVLVTDDRSVLEIGKDDADTLYEVTIKKPDNTELILADFTKNNVL